MPEPIRFYLDFASPYAYFALDPIETVARQHGRTVEWRPMLVWAVLRQNGMASPMDAGPKRDYLLGDMARSAAFYGVPYRPAKLPLSAHRASRLYYWLAERDAAAARRFGRDLFAAFFADGRDISDDGVVIDIASRHGVPEMDARPAMESALGRERLAAAVDAALADKVCGSPFFIVDGEGFFGVDRLPQIAWRLSQSAEARP